MPLPKFLPHAQASGMLEQPWELITIFAELWRIAGGVGDVIPIAEALVSFVTVRQLSRAMEG